VGKVLSEGLRREWLSMNMHLGNRYMDSPVIVYEDGESAEAAQAESDDAINYRPTSRPGCRAPHAWLPDGRSTLDLFGRGFLMIDFGGAQDLSGTRDAAASAGIPFAVACVDDPGIAALYERRLVLVRPDGHVAWRGDMPPADPAALLAQVAGHGAPQH
jgi:hypothetical protein